MSRSSTIKDAATLRRLCERRYAQVWADEVVAPGSGAWPYTIRVGRPSQAELEHSYAQLSADTAEVAAWCGEHGLSYGTESRKVGRMSYPVLSHVIAQDIDALAQAVGKGTHLSLMRAWAQRMREAFPAADDPCVRTILVQLSRTAATDADFELVCTAARWFHTHDASGYTPREVPLEGFHAKWLDAAGHRQMVCTLAGLPALELKDRPHLLRFRYLDPAYLASGGRAHDSWLQGDAGTPAYPPSLVIICENRDSALWFPPVAGGIAVLGDGMAGVPLMSEVGWIAQAERVLYWGDIDIHGFQILSAYRERGLAVRSILMDRDTFAAYERFGTSVDARGRPLPPKPDARPLAGLTPDENALYLELCSIEHRGHRRIEQERIPLSAAQAAVAVYEAR